MIGQGGRKTGVKLIRNACGNGPSANALPILGPQNPLRSVTLALFCETHSGQMRREFFAASNFQTKEITSMDIKGMKFQPVGENVLAHVTDEGVMLLAISTKQTLRVSQSGKSDTVATTGGNIPLAGVKVGVNVYRPLDPITIARRAAVASDAAKQANGGSAA